MTSAKKRRGRERKATKKKDNNGGGRTISTDRGVVAGGIDRLFISNRCSCRRNSNGP